MKAGSIVVILPFTVPTEILHLVKWLPIRDEQTPYTVREIVEDNSGIGVRLEEGIIGYGNAELVIDIKYVREVMPADMLEQLMEETMLAGVSL